MPPGYTKTHDHFDSIENASLTSYLDVGGRSIFFRKDFQNPKTAKLLFMKVKTTAIFGNDSRESFPNSLEE